MGSAARRSGEVRLPLLSMGHMSASTVPRAGECHYQGHLFSETEPREKRKRHPSWMRLGWRGLLGEWQYRGQGVCYD
jgi:hypothetical protein